MRGQVRGCVGVWVSVCIDAWVLGLFGWVGGWSGVCVGVCVHGWIGAWVIGWVGE